MGRGMACLSEDPELASGQVGIQALVCVIPELRPFILFVLPDRSSGPALPSATAHVFPWSPWPLQFGGGCLRLGFPCPCHSDSQVLHVIFHQNTWHYHSLYYK